VHIPNVVIKCPHKLTQNLKLKECNGFGEPVVYKGIHTPNPDFKFYYIDHYFSKSLVEFVDKLNKKFQDIIMDYIFQQIFHYFVTVRQ
jgi:hypothetical protein